MWGSGRFFSRGIDSVPKAFNSIPTVRHVSVTNKVDKTVVIPARIERKPTDILKALASTVNLDPTAPHYKYPDDPFFYPVTTVQKRILALALESGRSSARWVFKENPGFFKTPVAEPPIQAFIQSVTDKGMTEESLLRAIEKREVLRAIGIYESLKNQNQDVEKSTKQSLLELVCFYNSAERPEVEPEKIWFESFMGMGMPKVQNKWNRQGFAQILFQDMDPDCPLAISAMISGMMKYHEHSSALDLYDRAVKKRIKLSVNVYNSVIAKAYLVLKVNEIPKFILRKLQEMADQNVKPNLGTLNAALKSLSCTYQVDAALSLINEFLTLGIEPSLGSYGYLFQTYSRVKSGIKETTKDSVEKLMTHIESRDHEILHPCDLAFFRNAMVAFAAGFRDSTLVLRLADLYFKPSNMKFIVRAVDEHYFLRDFLLVALRYMEPDVGINIFQQHVFSRFCPDEEVFMALFEAAGESQIPENLEMCWRYLKRSDLLKSRAVLSKVLTLMENFDDELSLKVFQDAATLYLRLTDHFTPEDQIAIPNVLLALVKSGGTKLALQVVDLIRDNSALLDEMPKTTVDAVFEHAMSVKHAQLLIGTLAMASSLKLNSIGGMVEKVLPLLGKEDASWARGLVSKKE